MNLEPVPTPQDDLLSVALPSLSDLDPESPAAAFEWQRKEVEILSSTGQLPIVDAVRLASWRLYRGDLDGALEAAREAVRRSVLVSDWEHLVVGKLLEAQTQVLRGRPDEAASIAEGIDKFALLDVKPTTHLFARELEGLLLYFNRKTAQEDNDVMAIFEQLSREYLQSGFIQDSLRVSERASRASAAGEQYIQAIKHCEAALKISVEQNEYTYCGRLLIAAASAASDVGYRDHVEALFRLGREWAEYTGDWFASMIGLIGLGQYYGYSMDPTATHEIEWRIAPSLQARELCEAIGAYPLASVACDAIAFVYRKVGNRELADEWSRRATYTSTELEEVAVKYRLQEERLLQSIEQVRMDRMAARIHAGIESSPDLYFVFDPILTRDGALADLRNEFRNVAAGALLGIHASSVRMLSALEHHPYFEVLATHIRVAVTDKVSYHDMVRIDEPSHPTWITRSVVPSDQGALVIFRDITESRLVAEKMRIEAEVAKQAAEAQMRFMAHMSHEVRTPLNGVIGHAQQLADTSLDATQEEHVTGIAISSRQLLNFFNDILELSRIESGVRAQVIEPTNIVSLIDQIFRDEGIDVNVVAKSDMPSMMRIERDAFAFVVGRIASLMAHGSESTVSIEVNQDLVKLCVSPVKASIEDEALQDAISGRLDSPSMASIEGRWVGLYAASLLCREFGEPITVEQTRTGERSICFGLRYTVVEGASKAADAAESSLSGCRILMAEDNPVNVVVTRRMLEKEGCHVLVVGDGADAVSAYRSQPFDLVLMDVRMPNMDGLQATRAIRSIEEGSGVHIPIVALTAAAFTDERRECRDAGMDGFVAKPFSRKALLDELIRWYKPADER